MTCVHIYVHVWNLWLKWTSYAIFTGFWCYMVPHNGFDDNIFHARGFRSAAFPWALQPASDWSIPYLWHSCHSGLVVSMATWVHEIAGTRKLRWKVSVGIAKFMISVTWGKYWMELQYYKSNLGIQQELDECLKDSCNFLLKVFFFYCYMIHKMLLLER